MEKRIKSLEGEVKNLKEIIKVYRINFINMSAAIEYLENKELKDYEIQMISNPPPYNDLIKCNQQKNELKMN